MLDKPPINKKDMCKKVDLKKSKESSTFVFSWRSIMEYKKGNLKDVGLAMCKCL